MTISSTFTEILVNTISGIATNLPWFILIYLGFKAIAREVSNGFRATVKEMPKWIRIAFLEMKNVNALNRIKK